MNMGYRRLIKRSSKLRLLPFAKGDEGPNLQFVVVSYGFVVLVSGDKQQSYKGTMFPH